MDYRTNIWITVSYDDEAKRAKESIKVNVLFDFSTLTDAERLEWLVNGQSPRVHVQSILRKLPRREFDALDNSEYKVVFKPTGTRGEVDVEAAMLRKAQSMTPEQLMEFVQKLQSM